MASLKKSAYPDVSNLLIIWCKIAKRRSGSAFLALPMALANDALSIIFWNRKTQVVRRERLLSRHAVG